MLTDKEIRLCITAHGFITLFWQKVRLTGGSYMAVFEKMNDDYEAAYGIKRYASYDSFRKVRDKKGTKFQ